MYGPIGAALGVMRALGEEFEPDEVWGLSGLAFRTQVHRTLAPLCRFGQAGADG